MNAFSRYDWKKAARRAERYPDKADPGWTLARKWYVSEDSLKEYFSQAETNKLKED
jgi:hypothetical protein